MKCNDINFIVSLSILLQYQSKDDGDSAAETDVLQLTEPSKNNTSSIGGASFNFINSIIGSGIIGIKNLVMICAFVGWYRVVTLLNVKGRHICMVINYLYTYQAGQGY